MPRKAKQVHIHKLKRHNYQNGESVFFCASDCKFKINVSLALGKTTKCWRCGEAFELNEYAIRLTKPHCSKCTRRKVETHKVKISIDDILNMDHLLAADDKLGKDLEMISANLKANRANDKETSEARKPFEDLSNRLADAIHKIPMLAGRKNEESVTEDEDDLL